MKKLEELPDDVIYIINKYLNIRCRICYKKLLVTRIPLIKNKKYYCSKSCYLFI